MGVQGPVDCTKKVHGGANAFILQVKSVHFLSYLACDGNQVERENMKK